MVDKAPCCDGVAAKPLLRRDAIKTLKVKCEIIAQFQGVYLKAHPESNFKSACTKFKKLEMRK
jgi:hypothetical protein